MAIFGILPQAVVAAFWGFSILVLDWESFLNEIELDTLEEAGYTYELWKISPPRCRQGNAG